MFARVLLGGRPRGRRRRVTPAADVALVCRPCRERMLTVVAHESAAASSPAAGSGGSDDAGSVFAGQFREEAQMGLPHLAALLRAAGLERHWAAATGLPSLPEPSRVPLI